ncbi:glycine--tRNA ligase subunit beta [Qipengyuania flava]|uniref:Glycine--tRNA ligase beta subunit n=1 Tax=Qipengyuania flava TaxID=192812 RepID=A0A5P6NC92_9SPHN|nr:glycine--tRNA ligase subunit beta [Qipengyuania flava]KZX55257.1 glycine--tRNA ligase subunit beta [Erythrobacter sp. HI00D59]MBO9504731.1 glycine--tRNA ligase subunit beta [Qipengyuania flava]MCA0890342.1 glycine--tRNA ligase subunit beta [Qipengyuania flava]QFI63650.1 glycine--tRNA ligase subunit beta [Qipengyuania flava]
MSDFLLELRSEEIPARMQAGARAELEKLFRRELDAAGVEAGEITVWSTPRRLALIARGLPLATEAVSEELKGPPVGAPNQAVEGFCRKAGVDKGDLETRDVKGRATYFAVKNVPGRATSDLLAEAIPAIVRDFSWPKSMRWGAASISTESLRWVRPLSGVVALLDDDVVDCEVHGVTSGAVTLGHRFHHSGDITIGNAGDYAMKLRAAHVIVDHEERQDLIRSGAAKVASEAGLRLVEDEGLVIENAGLTEWPIPLLGRFEEDFLEVPPETIQLTARVNQKYFVCEDEAGELANAFICTANIEAEDGGARVVDGNRKVLAARLSDARFFWDVDRKKTLAEHAKGLERITFHEKLGTVADKVERVAKLADWLVFDAKAPNGDHKLARQAAELSKADLVTEMVGEFPELQGLMGGYYAKAEGLPVEVAEAIRDHYKPVGASDEVPTAPTAVAVSLADKLDNLLSFFKIDILPTGSKDPFALRRAALGYLRLVQVNDLKVSLDEVAHAWASKPMPKLAEKLADFLLDRLAVQLRDEGVRHDYVQASRSWQGRPDQRIDRVEARARALAGFLDNEDGANLLAGYKRAANILKKEDWHGAEGEIARTGEEDPLAIVDDPDLRAVVEAKMAERHAKELSYTPEPAEKALMDALANSEPAASRAIAAEDFGAAMAALADLRAPIDRFFEEVTVNADEENKRAHRLDLLAAFRAAVHKVADFSRIEG